MRSLLSWVKRLRGDTLAQKISRQQAARLADLATRVDAVEAQLRLFRRSTGQDMAKIHSQLHRLVDTLETRPTAVAPAPGTSDPGAWASAAQLGELGFHATNHSYRGNDAVWWSAVEADWLALGLDRGSWAGKTVLDVGAGSRLRTLWFEDVEVIVVEPLADRFLAEVPFCDLGRATEVHAVPGETYVPDLAGRADVVVSINALDHGFDMAASVRNIRRYLKPDGFALLSFDLHDTVSDHMHPMVVTHQMMLDIFAEVGFEVTRTDERHRYHGGTGPDARSYWLRAAALASSRSGIQEWSDASTDPAKDCATASRVS